MLASVTENSRPLLDLDPGSVIALGLVLLGLCSPVVILTAAVKFFERRKR